MTASRWLVAVALAGLLLFALSFVPAWIVHDREVRGEGYRFVQIGLSAWRGPAVPILTAAAVAAIGVAALALGLAMRGVVTHARAGWAVVIGSALVLGLLAASAVPIAQDGHASSVDLTIGWALAAGLVLGVAMVVGGVAALMPAPRVLGVALVVAVLALAAGAAGRWAGLQAAEGSGAHWAEGSYTRQAIGGEPTETLTISDGRISIGGRWAGTFESSGWTVTIDADPACPGSRGTYHAHGENDSDLRFVKVVDTCQDGARAADLETGIWEWDG